VSPLRPLLPLLLTALLGACGAPRPAGPVPVPGTDEQEQVPDVTLYGVRLQSFEGEHLVAAGRAERATYQRTSGNVVASRLVLRLPSRPGGAPRATTQGMEVRAGQLEGQLQSRQADASGGVVLRTSTGIVARTTRAQMDGATRNIRGQQPVTVQGPNYRHRADAFQLALEREVFTFSGAVESTFEGVSPRTADQNGVKQ
jgi:lipopolysaccharide export system protein LptC